jgi:acyl-CoA thioesterase-1
MKSFSPRLAFWWRAWWACNLIGLLVNFTTVPAMTATPIRLLALGDSLTAGFGLPVEDGFAAKLEAALRAKGYGVTVPDTGVSGDTSAGGRDRLSWALADHPDYAIVELGANDALRGLDPGETYANLDAILTALADRKIKVLLAGMKAPHNMGPDYVRAFDGVYPRLQARHNVMLYPFFLDGVALDPNLTLGDGLHPNAKGVDRIVAGILPAVETLLATKQSPKAAP